MTRPVAWSGRRTVVWAVAAACAAVVLSGCSLPSDIGGLPECADSGRTPRGGLVLMAQAVPTAQLIPCVRSIPIGWTFDKLDARNGKAAFSFDSDREGIHALVVSLLPTCSVDGATPVPGDRPGVERYERVTSVDNGYIGERIYQFDGGCAVYSFNLQGESRAEPVTEITEALGFVERADVAARVDEQTDGRLSLDYAESRTP